MGQWGVGLQDGIGQGGVPLTRGHSDQTLLGRGTSMNLNVHKESLESFYLVHLNISASEHLLWGTVDKKLCNINTKYFTMVHASNIFD